MLFHGSDFSLGVGIPFSAFLYAFSSTFVVVSCFFASLDAFALFPFPFGHEQAPLEGNGYDRYDDAHRKSPEGPASSDWWPASVVKL
jgi:hypothetical protein